MDELIMWDRRQIYFSCVCWWCII